MRLRRSLVLLVLLVAIVAAFAPSFSTHAHDALFATFGLLVPTIQITAVGRIASRSDERPVALRSLDFFRAPPALLVLA